MPLTEDDIFPDAPTAARLDVNRRTKEGRINIFTDAAEIRLLDLQHYRMIAAADTGHVFRFSATSTKVDDGVTCVHDSQGRHFDAIFPTAPDYSAGTAYVAGDLALDQGVTWLALQATTGNAPPTLPTTSNAYWQVVAAGGRDGADGADGVQSSDGSVTDIISVTQAEYDALTPNSTTFYIIT